MDRDSLSRLLYCTTYGNGHPHEDGRCHVCLRYRELTREHLPAKRAFNDCPALWERLVTSDKAKESARFVQTRGGFWVRSLCQQCNTEVCSRYAKAYVRFVRHLVESPHLFDSSGRARLLRVPCDTLLIAKQIATMVLASEPVTVAAHNPELCHFVLSPESTFRPRFNVYGFLVPDVPEAGTVTRFHGRVDTLAPGYEFLGGELSRFPFGFLYATQIGRGYDLSALTDVTHWFTTSDKRDRLTAAVSLYSRLTGAESIQCGVGRLRRGPQIDYIGQPL
jgi:hypothetical protein